jgi:molecular chaperone DnaK
VKEAEQFAQEDLERKNEVETRNNADQTVYTIEKTLKEMGDKISPEEKSSIETEVSAVRSALNGTDTEAIKTATEKLTNVSYEIFGKIYQQQQADPNASPGADAAGTTAAPDDNVVDADYEVVDNDENK